MSNAELLANATSTTFRYVAQAERELSQNPSDTALESFQSALYTYLAVVEEVTERCSADLEFASVYVQTYSELTGNG